MLDALKPCFGPTRLIELTQEGVIPGWVIGILVLVAAGIIFWVFRSGRSTTHRPLDR